MVWSILIFEECASANFKSSNRYLKANYIQSNQLLEVDKYSTAVDIVKSKLEDYARDLSI